MMCFPRHKWGKWERETILMQTVKPGFTPIKYQQTIQVRVCAKCNREQRNDL